MNKKFSTLLASVLLTSAFSVNAQVKEGDYVQLLNGSDALTVADQNLGSGVTLKDALTTATTPSGTYTEGAFEAINSNLWKIEKITKVGVSGTETFRFVNKQTGKYLAIKLHTNNKGVTKYAATLDASGNKDWAFTAAGAMYAYDAAKDSTYYIGEDMKLHAFEGNDLDEISNAQNMEKTKLTSPITLNAAAFNDLMALRGNDGKLHFNNGKDVSEKEENILKDTKWEAKEAGEDVFALTDGTTTKGYGDNFEKTSDGKSYRKIDKLNYLMVDTMFHDKKELYFALTKDTVPYEWDATNKFGRGSDANKYPLTRPAEAAQFTGVYYAGNDSLVLRAKYVPLEALENASTETAAKYSYSWTGGHFDGTALNGLSVLFTNASTQANKTELANAVTALQQNVTSFLTPSATRLTETSFNGNVASVTNKMFTTNATLSAWLEKLGSLKFVPGAPAISGGVTYQTLDALIEGTSGYASLASDGTGSNLEGMKTAVAKLDAALKSWRTAFLSGALTTGFSESYFSADGTQVKAASDGADVTTEGSAFTTALTSISDWSEGNNYPAANKIKVDALNINSTVAAKFVVGETEVTAENLALTPTYANEEAVIAAINTLKAQENVWALSNPISSTAPSEFKTTKFDANNVIAETGSVPSFDAFTKVLSTATDITKLKDALNSLAFAPASGDPAELKDIFFDGEHSVNYTTTASNGQLVLRQLSSAIVLTVLNDGTTASDDDLENAGYTVPLIQPFATTGGDAVIAADAKVYFLQVQNEHKNNSILLRAAKENGKYLVIDENGYYAVVEDVDAANVYAQWVFVPGATKGFYEVINRGANESFYTGPVYQLKDEDEKAVADTYVLGTDTLKLAAADLSGANIYTEKGVKYDYTGAFYAGDSKGLTQSFSIAPASQYLTNLAAQYKSDSTMVLGTAEDAPVWYLDANDAETYGLEIAGLPTLKKVTYKIYTMDADNNKYYVYQTADDYIYAISKLGSEHIGDKAQGACDFEFRTVAKDTYLIIDDESWKVTINPTPKQPILEASDLEDEKSDYFTITKAEAGIYRKLTAEDGVLGNAKIYMENEPSRYLYENTANIVANNGTGLNFLGIYNTAELTKNAALYVDTAYVEREGVYMPQYMFALGVTDVPAADAIACTYEHNHFDNAGNKVDAEHCSHATPATMGYKAGRYLVALTDSLPENGSKKTPVLYDNAIRLAFVNAIHRNAEDSLIIKDSKYTDNNKQIVKGEAKTYASNDTLKIADNDLNPATFALLIKDQETKSFYLENKEGYVRILNGVPVLTNDKEDAAVFNIEATTEEATANEAIAAEGVQVIGGKGAVTVQGAAGKVITVANILGQTIANQVAASDNVTIAVPAGIVVVAVEGEATKVVVK